ncbi:MAG: hypothetical protein Kow0075_00680 [Salibacteraceae bacterium]
MKAIIVISWILLLCVSNSRGQLLPNLGGQRTGISTLTFLKSDISPRSMALSGANLALDADGMAIAHNPALLSAAPDPRIAITDLALGAGAHQAFLSASYPLRASTSALGFNLNYFSTGPMTVRTEFQPMGTGEVFYAVQFATGIAYAKTLSDRFSFGVNLKYINERLAQYVNHTVAADLGFLYTTDVKELKFGIVVQNFGGNSSINGDYLAIDFNRTNITLDRYSVPTVFRLGASIKPIERGVHSLRLAVQLEHPNDNSENLRLGVEYDLKQVFYLRSGFKINVAGDGFPSVGFGYRFTMGRHSATVNYAVNATKYSGIFHGFGLDFNINTSKR